MAARTLGSWRRPRTWRAVCATGDDRRNCSNGIASAASTPPSRGRHVAQAAGARRCRKQSKPRESLTGPGELRTWIWSRSGWHAAILECWGETFDNVRLRRRLLAVSCSAVLPSSVAIEPCVRRTCVLALTSRDFPPHLVGRLVLAEADVNRVPQQVVSRPGQVGDLGDKLRLDPMHPRKNERRPKRVCETAGRSEAMSCGLAGPVVAADRQGP